MFIFLTHTRHTLCKLKINFEKVEYIGSCIFICLWMNETYIFNWDHRNFIFEQKNRREKAVWLLQITFFAKWEHNVWVSSHNLHNNDWQTNRKVIYYWLEKSMNEWRMLKCTFLDWSCVKIFNWKLIWRTLQNCKTKFLFEVYRRNNLLQFFEVEGKHLSLLMSTIFIAIFNRMKLNTLN